MFHFFEDNVCKLMGQEETRFKPSPESFRAKRKNAPALMGFQEEQSNNHSQLVKH